MIAYRDFLPVNPGLFPKQERLQECFDDAVAAANDWIARDAIDVINVETAGSEHLVLLLRPVRVWYRTTASKPRSPVAD